MKIVVCIRRLTSAPGRPAPVALGRCETAALQAAAALAASSPGAGLVAIAVGPERENEALAPATALGARSIRLWHPELDGTDYDALARALAAACRHVGFDLVLCGERTEDEGLGAIGPATAEHLGVPHLGAAESVSLCPDGRIEVRRRHGPTWRVLRGSLPLLVTMAPPAAPASAGAPAAKAARACEVLELAQVGLSPEELRHRRRFEGAVVAGTRPAEIVPDPGALALRLRALGLM